jgi:hypothetical protein
MLNFFTKLKPLHFIHIGKTGGSAVKSALKNHLKTKEYKIILHSHDTLISDIPVGEKIFFFLREPISRFISAFYSRQRKGQPLYYSEWSPKEKELFEAFNTPDKIASGLADNKPLAVEGMNTIHHFKKYKNFYKSSEYFQTRIDDILFVGFQETLDTDFLMLKSLLAISNSCTLPVDDIKSHKNPKNIDKAIDKRGVIALTEWYEEDFIFISQCKKIMSDRALV